MVNAGEMEMLVFWSLVVITTITLHWQFKFGNTGQTFKAFCIAVAYTALTFQFHDHKLLFITMFFFITLNLWVIVFVSMTITKQWAMNPKEEPKQF